MAMAAKLAAEKGGSPELRACLAELQALPDGPELDTFEAQRIGWDFHKAIFQAAGNTRLAKLYADVRVQNSLAMGKNHLRLTTYNGVGRQDMARAIEAFERFMEENRALWK